MHNPLNALRLMYTTSLGLPAIGEGYQDTFIPSSDHIALENITDLHIRNLPPPGEGVSFSVHRKRLTEILSDTFAPYGVESVKVGLGMGNSLPITVIDCDEMTDHHHSPPVCDHQPINTKLELTNSPPNLLLTYNLKMVFRYSQMVATGL